VTDGRLLMVDVLQAQFLDRQRQDRQAFHEHLEAVIHAPEDRLPNMALSNQMARQRARYLLQKEDAWF